MDIHAGPTNRRRPAVLLLIDANDSTGLTGLAPAQRVLAALPALAAPVATAVGFTHGDGRWRGAALPEAAVRRQVEGAREALPLDAVRIGYVGNETLARVLAEMAVLPNLVIDASFVDRAGIARLSDEGVAGLRALCALADLFVANAHEAERLTGRSVHSIGDQREAARRLTDLGPRHVLVTGGRAADHAVDLLYDRNGFVELGCDRRPDGHLLRGVGDAFTTAIGGYLGRGLPLPDAVDAAKRLVTAALDAAVAPAPRHHLVEPLAAAFEALSLDPTPIAVPEPEGGSR
jgi:hydroxymethylpyrimidine/phosphomethylpyrimidine kinase